MNQSSPSLSALINSSTEFFTKDGIHYKTSNGSTEQLDTFPVEFYNLLLEKLKTDNDAQKGLQKLGVESEEEKVHKYYECNYSHFHGNSDISACGTELGCREYGPCSQRGNCLAHGELCRIPCGLTRRQVEVCRRITIGEKDANICSDLFISQDTLRSHKNNIEDKIGGRGKVNIAVWSIKNLSI
ncbi:MAG TPA: LuxR C-terminal-related transcriptional regulator [Pedobacter sp.]|jgi:DNA-binding CsgD family transcriptional regulator